jgi:prevent-host-death family protein
MTILAHPHEVTVSEAAQRGVAGLITDAEQGSDVVVTRHHRPVAVVMAYQRMEELSAATDDLLDLAVVLARQATDSGGRTSFDDVLRAFGHTRESLAAATSDE